MTTEHRERQTVDATPRRMPTAVRAGLRAYQQIAAIAGAFALLAFLTNVVDIGLRGFVASLVGAWDEYVRPPVQWLTHYVIEVPLSWAGWDVELAQWLRDYLAVGLVLVLSLVRSFTTGNQESLFKTLTRAVNPRMYVVPGWYFIGLYPLFIVVLWPVSLALLVLLFAAAAVSGSGRTAGRLALVLSPLIYACILLTLNNLVL